MTLDQFISKYNNQILDWDKAFGGQCMDLYRFYVHEVLSFPQSPPVPGAKDVWNNYLTDRFDRIENTPTGVPEKGDVVIWGTKIGEFGHIAIFVEGTATKFNSFDQNFPVGTKCHIQSHTYTGVLGWLRPKKVLPVADLSWLKQMYIEQGIDLNKPEGEVRGRVQELFDNAKKYDEAEKRASKAERDLAEARGDSAKWEENYRTAVNESKRLGDEIDDLKQALAVRDSEITTLTARVEALEAQINPDKVIIVTREEYERLTASDPLGRASVWKLLKALVTKPFRRKGGE